MKTLSVFLLLALSASAQPGQTDRDLVRASGRIPRLALVIGNDAYPGNPLHNAVNDARSMKNALEESGFKVQLGLNVTQRQMEGVIDEFTGSVKPGDVALFFYAGHGMQINDQNYLVPVDFEARTAVDAKYKAYPAQRVQENLEAAGAGMQILVLDACRNNPFRSWRGGSDGLAAMQAGRGTYIAFATSPGKTAADNPAGQNGLFTGELITVLREKGFSIDQVFNRVRERVAERSHGQQLPWSTSSVTGEFYFKVTVELSNTIPAPSRDPSGERELAFWNSVKDENDASLLEEYLRKYPDGEFTSIAKSKLNRMKSAATPPATPLTPNGPRAAEQGDPFASRIPPNVSPNAVLANGVPPLTESMVDLYANFEAWLFEIPRTQQHRASVRAMMIEDWKKPADIKNDMSNLTMAAQIAQATSDQRGFIRCGLQPKVLQSVRADKDNPDTPRLLAAYEQAHQPIAPGDPPLTESMVSRFTAYLGWVLQIRLTQPLKDNLRAALLADWKQPKEIKSDMDFLNWQVDMANRSNEEKEYFRSKAEPEIIKAMRVDRGNPAAPWIVAAYDAAHPSIAAGNPPLTRQAADALTELLCFIRNQGGAPRQEADQAFKDANAAQLAQNYPKLSSEQQQKLAQMPQDWAMLRLAWVKGSEADRRKMVAQWQPTVQPSPQGELPHGTAANDPGANCALAAFENKDTRTMSEFQLLQAATDCDTAAKELRRTGGAQNLANAATWEKFSGNLRAAAIRQRGEQQATQAKSGPPPSQQDDPRREAALAAIGRFGDFLAKDPSTVSEQEMLAVARDCDIIAQEWRREGNFAGAQEYEQSARTFRAGRLAYLQQIAQRPDTQAKPGPIPQNDPRREAALAALRRIGAFLQKDASTVSEQEMLTVAKDCDFVAQEWRREGNFSGASNWEQSARNLRAGKVAYLKQQAAAKWGSVEGQEASERVRAFEKRDPNTVSEQELLRAAEDCDTVAREQRRAGGEANLANAATWDRRSRELHAGKVAWVKLWAQEQAQNAAARYEAFIKRDANTVSEQELAAVAKDALFVAQYCRSQGGEQNVANAVAWEKAARTVSVGKEAYVRQMAAQATKGSMTAEQFQFLWNAQERRYATAMNIIGNMSSSGYHYEIRH
jgi:hypothetical protein